MKNIFIFLITILLASCASVKVKSVYDPKANFSDYKTFCWLEGCDIKYQGPDYGYSAERMELLQTIIKEELEAKGLVNDQNSPDLLVGFHVIIKEQEVVLEKNSEMMNPYNRQISYWADYNDLYESEVHKFLKGSLIIDLIDAKTSSVVWQTTAQRYMETNPDIGREDIKKGIVKALRNFPPENK